MPEKSWSQIVTELRGLKNEILAMESNTDDSFLDIVDCLDYAADKLELLYQCSADWLFHNLLKISYLHLVKFLSENFTICK